MLVDFMCVMCPASPAAGPKTLCNACGVKLVRKNRGTAEAKRRTADEKAASAAAAAAHLLMGRSSSSPEPWSTGGDSGADETPLAAELVSPSPCLHSSPRVHEPSPLGPQQMSRRPVRRAAAKAASRTAEYATTGDWPQDEGVVPALGDAQSVCSPHLPILVSFQYLCLCTNMSRYEPQAWSGGTAWALTRSSVLFCVLATLCSWSLFLHATYCHAQDASVENSDSAEEVAWAPRPSSDAHATYAADALGLPHSMRQETSAAINLMAMSFKADKERARPLPSSPALSLAVPQTDASVPLQDPQVDDGPWLLPSIR